MYFQDLIFKLEHFWQKQGCVILPPFDQEVGAGTLSPYTFLKVLGKKPWMVAYVQPSRRPADGRYGENPNRLYMHHQFQVIIKPPLENIKDIYLESLKYLGLKLAKHEIKFLEDNWETAVLGAQGVGWEVRLDGLEITQFTYFQLAAGINLDPVSVEITYGLERLAMFLQDKDNIFDIQWNETTTYGELRKQEEKEECIYAFDESDIDLLFDLFNKFESEAKRILEQGILMPGYMYLLKCSHTFNLLDARGVISASERQNMIGRMRHLAELSAKIVLEREVEHEGLSI
ncbi:glycine--tRNA ligase subunit alpha [Caldisericum exile]|uniref:Glycine--tRNA ligase alpha subunit n=1 Tax=Caldisericum exile (strain DSM 21853 / NBRC 104410 / AZM16c01) TaxID=511051 RepID=A0A7U6JGW2_CALEA|nr:glycine--tRNA ligase subunit alpha [Caldisericum exile]BAL80962.1 glycyl-tRNA synthetase alpha subunit [Caldisericum exile AZM16c01]